MKHKLKDLEKIQSFMNHLNSIISYSYKGIKGEHYLYYRHIDTVPFTNPCVITDDELLEDFQRTDIKDLLTKQQLRRIDKKLDKKFQLCKELNLI